MSPQRIAVLLGGPSSEHDVSVNTGLNVLDALDPGRYETVPVYVDRDGGWHVGHRPGRPSLERDGEGGPGSGQASGTETSAEPAGPGVLERLRAGEFDVVFIALHGAGGEDGAIQGLLRFAGVPFTGSDVLASALAMDKVRTKQLLDVAGWPVPAHVVVTGRELEAEASARRALADRALGRLGLPCVVKPVAGGSSFATRVVREPGEILPALAEAVAAGGRAMVEEHVAGTEVTCGVLGGGPEPTQALPLTEIVPRDGAFFDFRAKYTAGACDEITPARVSEGIADRTREIAVAAHELLGCEGFSRVDFIVRDGEPLCLEVNTIPGLTETSLLPQGAAAAGIGFPELLERLIRSALLRAGRL